MKRIYLNGRPGRGPAIGVIVNETGQPSPGYQLDATIADVEIYTTVSARAVADAVADYLAQLTTEASKWSTVRELVERWAEAGRP